MSELQQSRRRSPDRTSAAVGVLVFIAVLWVAEVLDYLLPVDADRWGIQARELGGLSGVLFAPFLHGDFEHLLSNTAPLLVLGLLVAWRAGRAIWPILATVIVLGGLGVWLFAPSDVITIGASGVVFGLMGYLLAAGVITRRPGDIVLSLLVLFIYGSLLLGVTPFGVTAGVSWLAHLSGFAAGVLAAVWFAPAAPRQKAV